MAADGAGMGGRRCALGKPGSVAVAGDQQCAGDGEQKSECHHKSSHAEQSVCVQRGFPPSVTQDQRATECDSLFSEMYLLAVRDDVFKRCPNVLFSTRGAHLLSHECSKGLKSIKHRGLTDQLLVGEIGQCSRRCRSGLLLVQN